MYIVSRVHTYAFQVHSRSLPPVGTSALGKCSECWATGDRVMKGSISPLPRSLGLFTQPIILHVKHNPLSTHLSWRLDMPLHYLFILRLYVNSLCIATLFSFRLLQKCKSDTLHDHVFYYIFTSLMDKSYFNGNVLSNLHKVILGRLLGYCRKKVDDIEVYLLIMR